jgi:hypothetical protein
METMEKKIAGYPVILSVWFPALNSNPISDIRCITTFRHMIWRKNFWACPGEVCVSQISLMAQWKSVQIYDITISVALFRVTTVGVESKSLFWKVCSLCLGKISQDLGIRGSRFLSYNILQFAIDGKNNSKTEVEKVFFFIFMSSYAEMSF